MSKPIQAINRYKADLRELSFLLFEQFRVGELLGAPPFEAWGADECRSTLTECYRWVREVIGPLNAVADAQGCKLVDGKVVTPDGFKAAWKSLYEGRLESRSAVDPGVRRRGRAPRAPGSRRGDDQRGEHGVLDVLGPRFRCSGGHREASAPRSNGRSTARGCSAGPVGRHDGLLALTEPQAGSGTVGSASTTAMRNPDGSYVIRGSTKIFISGGDHDLTENIVHLVLGPGRRERPPEPRG